ncbi:MAG: tRNA (adenosine(37)-N6)-threonylcarbamoyltransferase complex dimerization subunit type 1 TsaB [Bacteroidetes bacterium]|nr:tRNA (adenosine(37)-N6)-threonylcarbamoyltransferase complex dimerization subunit type 1 TsaB [Bacteroidota bacterium]
MALILNIETATTVCSVALAKDGELLALKEINNGYTHAENLTVFIEGLVKEANIKFSDLDAIAISKGPGSYTGLRIGVSTAKGLCYGLGKALIGLSTLKCLTFLVQSSKFKVQSRNENISLVPRPSSLVPLLCPMLDARRMEVYCALYDEKLNEIEPIQAKIIDEHSFEEHLKNNVIYFFGDGAAKCREKLGTNANAVFIDNVFPSAAAMISFSEAAFNTQQFEDVAYFEPYYLKDFVAGPKKG